MTPYPHDTLWYYENLTFEFMVDFLEHFGFFGGYDLASISFSDQSVKVVVVSPEGQHIATSFETQKYLDWVATLPSKQQAA